MARLTPDAPFPPGCAARFRPVKLLASGGFGQVWLAEQVQLERRVAVKLLLDDVLDEKEAVERFRAEAHITASIKHPHVVRLFDHGVDEGVPWIALEYLPGRSLRDLLEQGRVTPELALAAASQVADALEAAHAGGVLHRDVKPENVLEVEPGLFKVTDFGIAKWRRDGAVKTRTGVILGTPAYLAPELALGEPVSPQADVYALGVLAYELFAGAPPFAHANPMALLDLQINAPPPPLRGVSPVIAGAVMRALAKRPDERTVSAARFREELNGVGGAPAGLSRSGATRAVVAPRRSTAVVGPAATLVMAAPARRGPWLSALAAGAALGLATWALVPRSPAPVVSATPATRSTASPSAELAAGPLALRYDVVAGERELHVIALTLEPVALELQVGSRSFREKAPTRRHRWEVTGLTPNTAYQVTIVDPTGRRQPAHPTRKARTRLEGFRDAAATSARRIGRADSTGLIANLELDAGALGVALSRLRAGPWQLHDEEWWPFLENVSNTRSPEALPLILEISNRMPPEIRSTSVWTSLGKLQDSRAYETLLQDLVGMLADGRETDLDLLGRAMFQSDPERAEALLRSWEKTVPQPNGRQRIALTGIARCVRRPWILAPLQRLIANARTVRELESIGEVAVRGAGAAALDVLAAAEARAGALGDPVSRARLLRLAAEIAGAGDAKHFLPHLEGVPEERAAALLGLGTIGARAHADRVRKELSSTDPVVRDAAIWAAGELRDELAVPELARLLTPLGRTAGKAVRALGQIGGKQAEDALMARMSSMQAVRISLGDPAKPEQIVEVGDIVLELARLRAYGVASVLENACGSPVSYIQARAIVGTALIGGRIEALALRGLAVNPEMSGFRDAVCGWLEHGRPAGTLVTVEPGRLRRTHLTVAVGQRFSLYTCGMWLDEKGQFTMLYGPDARQSGESTRLAVRVGVDVIGDDRVPLERTTSLDSGEVLLYPGPQAGAGGSMMVWVSR